jgi:hypothetical protein
MSALSPVSAATYCPAVGSFASSKPLALTALALLALSNIPKADAGPITYASCMAGCALMPPPFIPACTVACLTVLANPALP